MIIENLLFSENKNQSFKSASLSDFRTLVKAWMLVESRYNFHPAIESRVKDVVNQYTA